MRKDVEEKLQEAVESLYKEMPELISNRTHERTIVSHLAYFLKPLFRGWDVDTDYNREGRGGEPKRSIDGELIVPDIIIHKRSQKQGPNLMVIQVKAFWNKEDRNEDEADLRKLREKFKYDVLYRLELNSENFEIIEVN